MKCFYMITSMLAAIFAGCSEAYVLKTDKENDNLKGNVKSVMPFSV